MSGVVLLAAVLAIAGVVVWSVLNDNVAMDGKTRWLFAMRDEHAQAAPAESDAADSAAAARTSRGPRHTGRRNPS